MLTLHPSEKRGLTTLDWLESRHTFSFGGYYDPNNKGFGALRVLNDDIVAPGGGFPEHGHRDMEIVTYVIDGDLQHRDSMGNGSVIGARRAQRMTAGTGVLHSEYNASEERPVHLLQIWIIPERKGLEPSYEEMEVVMADPMDGWVEIASGSGANGAMKIHREVSIYAASLGAGRKREIFLEPGRRGWLQLISGRLNVNGTAMGPGDGLRVEGESGFTAFSIENAEFIWFLLDRIVINQ